MTLREMIEGVEDDGKFRQIVGMVSDAMEKGWSKWKTFRHVYKEIYGCKMCPRCCDDMVAMMESHEANGEVKKGEHWTKEQCVTLAKKVFDAPLKWPEQEIYATINMMWHDYRHSLASAGVTSDSVYAKLAADYLDDPDAPKGKLFNYYMFLCGGEEE